MGASIVLQDLQEQGFQLRVNDGRLLVTPPPPPAIRELLRNHKLEILQLLANVGGTEPPMIQVDPPTEGTDTPPVQKRCIITPRKDLLPVKMQNNEVILPGEREPLLAAWAAFRQEHGRELADLGWTRETLLDGLDPAKAANWDQMPFFPVLLKGGGQLLSATRIWLKFKDRHFGIIWRVQPGRWLGDIDFFDWYAAFDERAAIRQFDGRQTREQAELAAAEDLVLFDRIERLPLDGRYKADTH